MTFHQDYRVTTGAMFEIEPHPDIADTLRIRLNGLWNVPTMLVFERAMATATQALGCAPGDHRLLIDLREFETQSEEVILMCRSMIERGVDGRGVAFVVGAGSARDQLPQVIGDASLNIFEHDADADAWLIALARDAIFRAA